ncbi:MAG: hypothetical protein EOO89_26630 [Pedobacter sp.]|nr:MAG: hypothetical protein EOO89_26630 [Pedobacter sp.]
MEFTEFTPDLYRKLRDAGYKFIVQGNQLSNEHVEYEEGTAFSHFEVWPAHLEPVTHNVYDPIDSPEALMMANGGIDDVFFWIKNKYNKYVS